MRRRLMHTSTINTDSMPHDVGRGCKAEHSTCCNHSIAPHNAHSSHSSSRIHHGARVNSRHKFGSGRLFNLLVILSVIIPSALSEQFTVTSTTAETTTFIFTSTTTYETTSTASPTTTAGLSPGDFICDCPECVGATISDCDPAVDAVSDYINPVECPVNNNCTTIKYDDKFGNPTAYVRKCLPGCQENLGVVCAATITPDIHDSTRVDVTPSDLEGSTCTIVSCDCQLFAASSCTPNPEGTVTTNDEPSCAECTGDTKAECTTNSVIMPCTESDAVCLEVWTYDNSNVLTSVSVSCASYATAKSRILTTSEFNACSSSSSTCRKSSPATLCADEPQMCPSSLGSPVCDVCTNADSIADCDANSVPTICSDALGVCLLTTSTDIRGAQGVVNRECTTKSYCDANNLPLNVEVSQNTTNTIASVTCLRPQCSESAGPVCTYMTCPVCDASDPIDARILCDGSATMEACAETDDYCKAEATIDQRGAIIRFKRFCATTVSCPDSSYFYDGDILDNCMGLLCEKCTLPTCSNTTQAPATEAPTTQATTTDSPNPCDSNPCYFAATCVSSDQVSEFVCECPDGWTGKLCDIRQTTNLLQFGTDVGDATFLDSDDGSVAVQFPHPFQFFGSEYTTYYVNTNGYITLGRDFWSYFPTDMPPNNAKPDLAMIAPLWMDLDTVGSTGEDTGIIYYQTYEKLCKNRKAGDDTETLFDSFEAEIAQTGDLSFKLNAVTVITWVNVTFYDYTYPPYNRNERVTFQLALGMDYVRYRSYAIFLYKEILTPVANRHNRQGYTSAHNNAYTPRRSFEELPTSGRDTYRLLPELVGDSVGRFVFRTSTSETELTSDSPESQCWEWNCQETPLLPIINFFDIWILTECPCSYEQARLNGAFSADTSTGCATTVDPSTIFARRCCYLWNRNANNFDLLDTSEEFSTGSLLRYHPDYYTSNYVLFDRDPKEWCCSLSNNCPYFYEVRPSDNCFDSFPPFIAFGAGDPHITTIDGHLYTYQGLGQYWLLKSDALQLQGRTKQISDSSGNPIAATVWEAFAFKDSYVNPLLGQANDNTTVSASRVQIKLIATNNVNELDIYLQESKLSLTDWFRNANDNEKRVENRLVFKRNGQKLSLLLPSSVSIDAEVGEDQLVFTVTYPVQKLIALDARGLLGRPNGVKTDDFTAPDGTVIPIGSSCATIRDEFGNKWKITKLESLFQYEGMDTFDSHEAPPGYVGDCTDPTTYQYSDPAEEALVQDTCGSDIQCQIDYILTRNPALAGATANVIQQKDDDQTALNIIHPIIDGPSTLFVQVGETTTLTLTVNNTAATTTITPEFTLPPGASFDAATGIFTWTPPDPNVQPFNMIFGGMDDQGTTAVPLMVTVTFCNCELDKGNCPANSFPNASQGFDFEFVQCMCEVFYSGPTCEDDYDFCDLDALCPDLLQCMDTPLDEHLLNPTDPGYRCTGCPDGYELYIDTADGNVTKCRDIDECSSPATNNCQQECINIDANFTCGCFPGYTAIDAEATQCQDTDECALRIDNCEQDCTNNDGNYTCGCVMGYDLEPDGYSCTQDMPTATACANLTCSFGCADTDGDLTYKCFCASGYRLDGSLVNCTDINECILPMADPDRHQCDVNADCGNTDGSYDCACRSGYTLNTDDRTCSPCDPLKWGPNCANICQRCRSAAYCDNVMGCMECMPGYDGMTCTNVDECSAGSDDCDPAVSICHDLDGSFSCLCLDGYESTNAGCVEVDDCVVSKSDGSAIVLCGDSGTCMDLFMDYFCNCSTGFTGRNCEINIDDCTTDICLNEGMCHDLVNSYTCTCQDGYYGANCEHLACQTQPNMEMTEVFYNGSMLINEDYTAELEDESSLFYMEYASAIIGALENIYGCRTEGTIPLFKDIINLSFSDNNTLIGVEWTLVLSGSYDRNALEQAIIDNIDLFARFNISIQSITYIGPPTEIPVSLDILAIVLGTVGGIIFICIFVVCIMCVLWRIRRRDRDATTPDSDTSSEREEPVKPGPFGQRFGRLHWQDVPSMRTTSIPPSTTEPSEEDDRYIPRIPRPRIAPRPQNTVPNIDWSVLRNFSNRFGYGGAMPASGYGQDGEEDVRQAPPIHRGTPPYRKKGQFYWVPTDNDE